MEKELITRKELAEKMQVSQSTILRWERKGMPSYSNRAIHPRYNHDEVMMWIKMRNPLTHKH